MTPRSPDDVGRSRPYARSASRCRPGSSGRATAPARRVSCAGSRHERLSAATRRVEHDDVLRGCGAGTSNGRADTVDSRPISAARSLPSASIPRARSPAAGRERVISARGGQLPRTRRRGRQGDLTRFAISSESLIRPPPSAEDLRAFRPSAISSTAAFKKWPGCAAGSLRCRGGLARRRSHVDRPRLRLTAGGRHLSSSASTHPAARRDRGRARRVLDPPRAAARAAVAAPATARRSRGAQPASVRGAAIRSARSASPAPSHPAAPQLARDEERKRSSRAPAGT
jgi:hypothetical protein